MKMLYFFRVFIISIEFLAIIAGVLIYLCIKDLQYFKALKLNLHDDALKYVVLLPLSLGAWVLKDSRSMLYIDKDTTRIVTLWPNYWQFKIHVFVSIIYSVIFFASSLVSWMLFGVIDFFIPAYIFLSSLIGQSVVAASIYFAKTTYLEKISNL